MNLLTVPVEHLSPHPDNPRGKIAEADVADLAAAIQAQGLLAPLVVRAAPKARDRYQVLSGHRRLAALKKAGIAEATVSLVEADDASAAAIMLVDNVHREDLDPFRTSTLIASMLQAEGATVVGVAERLGKPAKWVAQRRELVNLSPKWRKEWDATNGELSRNWSVPMLLVICELAPEAQERVFDSFSGEWWELHSEKDVRSSIGEELHRLRDASWDPDDLTLVPKAGSCAACPKQSQHSPGLFDDAEAVVDIKKATCRDSVCWAAKAAAVLQRKIKEARDKHGKDVALVYGQGSNSTRDGEEIPRGALSTWEYSPSKEGAKGARPAVIVTGKDRGEVTWVKPTKKAPASTSSGSSYSPTTGKTKVTAEEQREWKRLGHATDLAKKALKGLKVPGDPMVVLGLVEAFGFEAQGYTHAEQVKAFGGGSSSVKYFAQDAWDEVRFRLNAEFDPPYQGASDPKDRQTAVVHYAWLAKILGLPWAEYEAAALAEIPEPKLAVESKKARILDQLKKIKKPAKKPKRALAGAAK